MEKPSQAELAEARAASEKAAAEKAAAEQKKQATKPSENVSTGEPSPLDERLKALEEQNAATQKQLAGISAMLSALTSFPTPTPAAGVSPTAEVQSGVENSPPAQAAGGNGAAAQPNPLMMMLFQKLMGGGGGETTKLEALAFKSLESDIQLKNTIINTLLRKGMRTQPLFEPVAEGGYHE